MLSALHFGYLREVTADEVWETSHATHVVPLWEYTPVGTPHAKESKETKV